MLMEAERSCLLVVDVQERLLPVMDQADRVVTNSGILMRAAQALDLPILVSEQYPRGLGATVSALANLAPANTVIEKIHFSCLSEDSFAAAFRGLKRAQAVVAGIEAHVCVLQTVIELRAAGVDTFVVADATSSRTAANHEAALERMRGAGAVVVSTEMVVFEWLRRADTPQFKQLSALIK